MTWLYLSISMLASTWHRMQPEELVMGTHLGGNPLGEEGVQVQRVWAVQSYSV